MKGMKRLNLDRTPDKILKAEEFLRSNMIGQEAAVKKLMEALNIFYARLGNSTQPVGALLFAGPSGVGKTLIAKLFSYVFLDEIKSFNPEQRAPATLINGSEFQRGHESSKIIGAPPGYAGFKETPMFAQSKIDEPHFGLKRRNQEFAELFDEIEDARYELKELVSDKSKFALGKKKRLARKIKENMIQIGPLHSLIIFDEFEKVHLEAQNLLLQILEEGKLDLGDGKETDFRNSFIIFTSNTGQEEIKRILSRKPSEIGIGAMEKHTTNTGDKNAVMDKAVKEEVKKTFSTAFLSRLGGVEEGVVVFLPHTKSEVRQILDIKLAVVAKKVAPRGILLEVSEDAKQFLISKGHSKLYGVRKMDKVVHKYLLKPLAVMINLHYNVEEVFVEYDKKEGQLVFCEKEIKYLTAGG